MALEYISNSEPHREKMAAKIQPSTAGKKVPSATIVSSDIKESDAPSTSIETPENPPPAKKRKTSFFVMFGVRERET